MIYAMCLANLLGKCPQMFEIYNNTLTNQSYAEKMDKHYDYLIKIKSCVGIIVVVDVNYLHNSE